MIQLLDSTVDGPAVDTTGPTVDTTPACRNGQQDSGESDVDCGGSQCLPCTDGKRCGSGSDCASGLCLDGRCRDVCSVWTYTTTDSLRDSSVAPGADAIYSVGSRGAQGYLVALDLCGQRVRERTLLPSGAASANFKGVRAFSTTALYVAGEVRPASGVGGVLAGYGRFTRTDLSPANTLTLSRLTDGHDSVFGVDHDGVNAVMAATSDWQVRPGESAVALVASTADNATCDFALHSGQAMGVRVIGQDIYWVGQRDASLAVVARSSSGACAPPTCSLGGCAASWRVEFQVDTNTTKAVDATVARYLGVDYLYLSGFYNLDNPTEVDTGAYVMRIRLDQVSQRVTHRWNPTQRIDSFGGITSDGAAVYVAATRGSVYQQPQGEGLVKAFSLDLQPQWETVISTQHGVSDIELLGADGLVVTGTNDAGSSVTRCLRSGRCSR